MKAEKNKKEQNGEREEWNGKLGTYIKAICQTSNVTSFYGKPLKFLNETVL